MTRSSHNYKTTKNVVSSKAAFMKKTMRPSSSSRMQNTSSTNKLIVASGEVSEAAPTSEGSEKSSSSVTPVAPLFIDEEAMLAESSFAITPDDLIQKAKVWLAEVNSGNYERGALSDDFEFVGPVVGPLGPDAFIDAVKSFTLQDGIPDLSGQLHHLRVDPFEPSRVWFTTRTAGTHTGVLAGMEPTGKSIASPPQACSLRFNEDGTINQYTIGYVMDRRIGNTGGLGGVFGIFYAIGRGLPFPEAQPWKMSKRYRFFNFMGDLSRKFRGE